MRQNKVSLLVWMGVASAVLSSIFSAVIINMVLRNFDKISNIQNELLKYIEKGTQ